MEVPQARSLGHKEVRAEAWIYGPWTDLIIGCGAWSAPLLLLTASVSGSRATHWSFTFYFLALLFNYPHFMATVYRAYHSNSEFQKYKIFTVHIALLLALTGMLLTFGCRCFPGFSPSTFAGVPGTTQAKTSDC